MLKIKIPFDKTRTLVTQHPTITACVATAVVTHRITYVRTLRNIGSTMLEEASNTVYAFGKEAGVMRAQLDVLYEFLEEQGLKREVFEFIADLKG